MPLPPNDSDPTTVEFEVELDLKGGVKKVDPTGLALMGYDGDKVPSGLTLKTLLHPSSHAAAAANLHRVASGEHIGLNTYNAVSQNGQRMPISVYSRALKDSSGKVYGIGAHVFALFQMPKLNATVHAIEAMRRTVADLMPSGMFTVDRHQRITSWNRAAAQITGLDADAVIGIPCRSTIHCSGADGCPLTTASMEPPLRDRPCTLTIHGHRIYTLKNFDYLKDTQGRITGAVECFVDQTRQREAEIAIQEAQQLARSASQAKSEFMANMSHEIRTPMNGILGLLNLLLGTRTDATQQEYLRMAQRSATLLMHLVNDLLDFSIMEKGQLNIERTGFSLSSIIASVFERQQHLHPDSDVVLVQHFDNGVPQSLLGDPGRLFQVLHNLVDNAMKFTRAGTIKLLVSVKPTKTSADPNEKTGRQSIVLQFEIRDTGIGIPQDKLSDIFDAFTQADGSFTRSYGGLGLGLNVAFRIVALLGGRMWVHSKEGQGTAFFFTLPFGITRMHEKPRINDQPTDATPQEHATPDHLKQGQRCHILLVEDDPLNRKVAHRLLRKRNDFRVTCAENGPEAIEAVAGEDVDAVLMDIRMPGMDGYDTARIIRQKGAEMPIIALTDDAFDTDRDRCLQAGMNDLVTKPVDWPALLDRLTRMIPAAPSTVSSAPAAENRCQEPASDYLKALMQAKTDLMTAPPCAEKQLSLLKQRLETDGHHHLAADVFRLILAARKKDARNVKGLLAHLHAALEATQMHAPKSSSAARATGPGQIPEETIGQSRHVDHIEH